MGVLNFWAPGSQCVNMQGGNGEFGQLITKKNQGVLQVLYFFFFFFYCLAGIVSLFHRLSIVNTADS